MKSKSDYTAISKGTPNGLAKGGRGSAKADKLSWLYGLLLDVSAGELHAPCGLNSR